MADQTQDAAPAATPDDPFDIGNTDFVLSGDALPHKAEKTPQTAENLEVAPERPRNPDGTFSAFKEHVELQKPDPLSKHASYLVEAARDFGYSDDEIGEMSVSLLHKTMWQAQRKIDHERQQALNFRTHDQQQVKKPEPQSAEEPEYDLGIDNPEDYDPKLIGALKKLGGTQKEINDLKKQLAQRDQRDRERGARRSVAMIDAAFAALPEYKKIFGEGPGTSLGPDKPEMRRRIAVLRQAGIDSAEIASVGELRAKIKQVTEDLYPSSLLSTTSEANPYEPANPLKPEKNGKAEKPRITAEEWEAATLARPTQRKGKEIPKGDALAVAELTKKMREGGEVIPDSEELDGFFD